MGMSPAVTPVRQSLASGLRMAVKIKPEKGWLRPSQPRAGRVARTQGMGHLLDSNSENLLILHALGSLLARPCHIQRVSLGPYADHTLQSFPGVPCLARGKGKPVTEKGSSDG